MSEDVRLPRQSELFTVRLWPEEVSEDQVEWRGRVQHALSGRTGYFRAWSGLLEFFTDFLQGETRKNGPAGET